MGKLVINFPGKKKNHKTGSNTCEYCGSALGSEWIVYREKKYHPLCFENHIQLKCLICGKAINGEYYEDEWGNMAHVEHNGKKTKHCSFCTRIINDKEKNLVLSDGRNKICSICLESVIFSREQIEISFQYVISLFDKVGFNGIPDSVKIRIVSKFQGSEKNPLGSHTSGITKTRIITYSNGRKKREHEIEILEGLPSIEFNAVLAHELLHVWLNEQEINLVTNAKTEGFCNLGAYLVYSTDSSKLSEILLQRMYKNYDLIYGAGFRNMLGRLKKSGWKSLINEIKFSGK
jgi:hypothetical protein